MRFKNSVVFDSLNDLNAGQCVPCPSCEPYENCGMNVDMWESLNMGGIAYAIRRSADQSGVHLPTGVGNQF